MNKKAAMFGLDARIALAIFGALSVISGAALYSAIQQAKVTALVTDFKEIEKAIEQYVLDTGSDIPLTTSAAHDHFARDVDELFTSAVSGWNGPYLPNKYDDSDPDDYYRRWNNIAANSNMMIRYYEGDFALCDGDAKCYYWIELNSIPVDIGKGLDLMVDGSEDRSAGSLRYNFHSNPEKVGLYIKSIPMLK